MSSCIKALASFGRSVERKDDGSFVELHKDRPEDNWNTHYMKSLRLAMLKGEKPPVCRKCYDEEESGYRSKRMWENDLWEKEIDGIHQVAEHDSQCNISLEYKPNGPRAYSLLPNLTSTLLAISQVGLPNLGVTLDFAHLLYANEQPAFSAALVSKSSKLLGTFPS